jgi:SAM-dependent methyltransferase
MRYIASAISTMDWSGLLVDVGAGHSVLAEMLSKRGRTLGNVLLLDSAPAMLSHSAQYQGDGALLTVADATLLPLRPRSASLIVASLGDAFNVQKFWDEVAGCLGPSGTCIFTAPAYEWARSFRRSAPHECDDLAYFELSDARSAYVPSIINSVEGQRKLIEHAGLRLIDVSSVTAFEIPIPYSPKILSGNSCDPIVTGYTVIAPD